MLTAGQLGELDDPEHSLALYELNELVLLFDILEELPQVIHCPKVHINHHLLGNVDLLIDCFWSKLTEGLPQGHLSVQASLSCSLVIDSKCYLSETLSILEPLLLNIPKLGCQVSHLREALSNASSLQGHPSDSALSIPLHAEHLTLLQ
jgi:hypothetical protein